MSFKTLIDSYIEETKEVNEGLDTKLLYLVKNGLIPDDEVSAFKAALLKLQSDGPITMTQKTLIIGVFEKLVDLIVSDPSIFQKVKKAIQ